MIAEIILVPNGMELDAAKASAQYVARGLSSLGLKVRGQIGLCQDAARFQQAVATALSRSNVLVTVGGLGEGSGYLVKDILSRGLGLPLEQDSAALLSIREYCRRTGEVFEPHDARMALLPRGAEAFPCSFGKIPGCAISSAKQHIVLLPETQAEIAPMFNKYVAPYLGGTATTTVTHTLRTYGVLEYDVREALGELLNAANPAVTVQRADNEVLVRVEANAATPQQAAAAATPVLRAIVDRLGDAAYGLDVDSLQAAVVDKLTKKNLDIAIAEAGTGGMLTRVIGETPGGQEILRYSVAADTAAAKEDKLGIKPKMLKKWGNISEYAAIASASAAREKANASLGVSISANTYDERSKHSPHGVVYIAVASADTVYVKKLVVGDGDAEADVIVDAALSRALNMTRLVVDYYPGAYLAASPLAVALNDPTITELQEIDEVPDFADAEEITEGSFFSRNFIIRKADRLGVKVRKFVFVLALLIFLGSAGYVGLHYYSAYTAKQQAEELQNMFLFGDMEDVEVSPDYPKNYSLRFAGLWNVNRDVIAFISISDTGVRYPIVQAEDNLYYLRRDFYGNSNQYGIPFMDYRADVKEPSDNLVIYGHNMMDGQIFGELIPYNPKQYGSIGYYREHPVIDCTTVYDENRYKIFSVFITNAYESQGPVFAYHDFIDAKSDDDFNRFVSEVTKRSLVNTTVDVKPGDKLLTLSTCTYEFKDARLVVVARALRHGESDEVDTANATLNQNPLMPDIWYKTFGGSKPDEGTAEVATQPTTNRLGESSALNAVVPAVSSRGASASVNDLAVRAATLTPAAGKKAANALVKAAEAVLQTSQEIAAKKASEEAAAKAASEAEAARVASEAAESKAAASKAASEEAAVKAASEAAAKKAAVLKAASEAEEAERLAEESRIAEEEAEAAQNMVQTMSTRSTGSGSISVNAGGSLYKDADELDIISRLVQAEIGASFHKEAIKAQAVAAYSFIKNANNAGSTPSVVLAAKADDKVVSAVSEVLGEAVYYRGAVAFTPYYATSAGSTASSASVWGGGYPYLVSVDSSVDKKVTGFKSQVFMSRQKVESLIAQKLGITPSGSPDSWFEVLTYSDGDYNGDMSVCGETRTQSGAKITGRLLREQVLGLRSASFEVSYDAGGDQFSFVTRGYGHGVGLSQNGANLMAQKGMSYIEILQHYYPGTSVQ